MKVGKEEQSMNSEEIVKKVIRTVGKENERLHKLIWQLKVENLKLRNQRKIE